MRTTCLVLLGLVAISFAAYTVKEPKPFKLNAAEIEKSIPSNNKVSFGDLVTLFQTHDFKENSQIVEFLNKLRGRIVDEHNNHWTIYQEQKEKCREEIEFRDQEITDAKNSWDAAIAHQKLCVDDRATAEGYKALAELNIPKVQKSLDDLETQRAEEKALFESRLGKLDAARKAIAKLLEYLNDLENQAIQEGFQDSTPDAGLIQLANKVLVASVSFGQIEHVLPIYNSFLQAHSQDSFDINQIEEIIVQVNTLAGNVEQAETDIRNQEAADIEFYNTKKASLEAELRALENQRDKSAAYILEMNACDTDEANIITLASGKHARNTELKGLAQEICTGADNEWTAAEQARNTQQQLLNQLQRAIEALAKEYGDSILPDINTIIKPSTPAPE